MGQSLRQRFAKRMRAARDRAGLTQTEVRNMLPPNPDGSRTAVSTISRWETEGAQPSWEDLEAVASAYETSVCELLCGGETRGAPATAVELERLLDARGAREDDRHDVRRWARWRAEQGRGEPGIELLEAWLESRDLHEPDETGKRSAPSAK